MINFWERYPQEIVGCFSGEKGFQVWKEIAAKNNLKPFEEPEFLGEGSEAVCFSLCDQNVLKLSYNVKEHNFANTVKNSPCTSVVQVKYTSLVPVGQDLISVGIYEKLEKLDRAKKFIIDDLGYEFAISEHLNLNKIKNFKLSRQHLKNTNLKYIKCFDFVEKLAEYCEKNNIEFYDLYGENCMQKDSVIKLADLGCESCG